MKTDFIVSFDCGPESDFAHVFPFSLEITFPPDKVWMETDCRYCVPDIKQYLKGHKIQLKDGYVHNVVLSDGENKCLAKTSKLPIIF